MATSDAPLNVPNVTLAVARSANSGFTAEPGFALADNGDGTLTITDGQSRFGTKPNAAKPVWFFDFGSGSDQPHPTLSRQQKVIDWATQCAPNQVVAKAGSTHSMTIDTAQAGGSNSVFASGDATLSLPVNSGRKYFRYCDVYNDFTFNELTSSVTANTASTRPNLKQHRWQSIAMESGNNGPYLITAFQGAGDGLYRFFWKGDEVNEYTYKFYGESELATKQWRVEEEYHEVSSAAGVDDSTLYALLDGELKVTYDNVDSHNGADPTGDNTRWDHYKLANFRFWAATGVAPWRQNILYVDDSWCRIYITDKPTWNSAEKKLMEIQIPKAWESSGLSFNLRRGQFSNLSGKYLWVADNDDNKLLVGGWN